MNIDTFLHSLVPKLFKCVPLKQENQLTLTYLNSLMIEFNGATETFPMLKANSRFITIINTINYFRFNDIPFSILRKEIFKCISEVEKLIIEIDKVGDNNV